MPNATPDTPDFFARLARVLNSGQSRSVLLTGNVHDLFRTEGETIEYLPLIDHLARRASVPGILLLVYELNGPVRLLPGTDWDKIRAGWVAWRQGTDAETMVLQSLADRRKRAEREMIENEFDATVMDAVGKPTVALEFLRQLTLCSRSVDPKGRPYIAEKLLILVEAADLLLPAGNGEITQLNAADRQRVFIVQDWFSDPGFTNGGDAVVLISESRSLVHPRVSRLPQVLSIDVPRPDVSARRQYAAFMAATHPTFSTANIDADRVATLTAGLTIHALRQLLLDAFHGGGGVDAALVNAKVEEVIAAQLGEDVIEFKRPTHTLDDVIGFTRLKAFLRDEMLPRMRSTGADALPGAAVAGPIGGGKTFIFEAAASELGLPVLVLKNIRSQWFGQTDVLFERLRAVLESLGRVVIFVDEADTQFGGVGADIHETEKRLTGKVQQMMSDPSLRGKVTWLLMTARIQNLSPDIRRPGRVGDLILPVLDPEGDDRRDFVRWMISSVLDGDPDAAVQELEPLTLDYSAASFASLRSTLKARAAREDSKKLPLERIEAVLHDHLPPAIGRTRRYQTLQALVNCTRRSLLPDPDVTDEQRQAWRDELRLLEAAGVS